MLGGADGLKMFQSIVKAGGKQMLLTHEPRPNQIKVRKNISANGFVR